MKKQRNFIENIQYNYEKELKRLRRRKFLLKAKIFLTLVLPVLIILLAIKVAQTYLRLHLKKVSSQVGKAVIKPVKQIVSKPEFVKPEPVQTMPAQTLEQMEH